MTHSETDAPDTSSEHAAPGVTPGASSDPAGDGSVGPAGDASVAPAIERSAYLWNTASGLLMAFQSVIMLMVLTRVADATTAGVFTLAYANANLFLNLGKYGIRNFQVSDVDEVYSFRTYWRARVVTTLAMVALGGVWLAWSASTVGYSAEKTLTVLVMVLLKAVDSLEDVYHGNYQQHGRLDVAAKVLTLRLLALILVFAGLTVALRSLLVPLVVTTAFTLTFFVGETIWARRAYGLPVDGHGRHGGAAQHGSPARRGRGGVIRLLKDSFPVFLALFLLFYIGNAPKYAIDGAMDDAAQAYYGYIAMPVFVVGLLASFVYNPIIASLAQDWAEGRAGRFGRRLGVQSLVIVGITIACMAGAWLIGIPVLGALYNTNLAPYKADLLVLLAGGGFLALVTLFTTGITIMRQQGRLTLGYVAVSVAAAVLCPLAVGAAGIDGASWVYLGLMAVLTLWFGVIFAVGVLMGARRARG